MCGTAVNHQRQIVLQSQLYLKVESCQLFLFHTVVPVIVQSHLTDTNIRMSRCRHQFLHALKHFPVVRSQIRRMQPHHRIQETGIFLHQTIHGHDAGLINIRQENLTHSILTGPFEHLVYIFCKLLTIKMSVCVDNIHNYTSRSSKVSTNCFRPSFFSSGRATFSSSCRASSK